MYPSCQSLPIQPLAIASCRKEVCEAKREICTRERWMIGELFFFFLDANGERETTDAGQGAL